MKKSHYFIISLLKNITSNRAKKSKKLKKTDGTTTLWLLKHDDDHI